MRAIINDDITNISVDLYAPLVSEEFHAGLGILAWLKSLGGLASEDT